MQRKALYEARWILFTLFLFWAGALVFAPWVSLVLAACIVFTFYFFRDPDRSPPEDPALLVAPADGRIVGVDRVEDAEFMEGPAMRISIFLSIFDVHVNRAPMAGEVVHSEHRSGRFLDARNPESAKKNERRTWAFRRGGLTVVVRQITGAVARRIVAWARVGDPIGRGERFGMIRFGSRTELYVPVDAEILVSEGEKVRGGETPMARWREPVQ